MKLTFEISGNRIEFFRNWFTGSAKLITDTETKVLQSPLNPATHFSMKLKKQWHHFVKGHDVVIEKERPLFFAAFRPQTYRVFIDKDFVKEQKGF